MRDEGGGRREEGGGRSSQRSSKESRQTGRKTKSKCMDKRRLRSGFQVFFVCFFQVLGTKIDGNGVPGPGRDQVGTQTPKNT